MCNGWVVVVLLLDKWKCEKRVNWWLRYCRFFITQEIHICNKLHQYVNFILNLWNVDVFWPSLGYWNRIKLPLFDLFCPSNWSHLKVDSSSNSTITQEIFHPKRISFRLLSIWIMFKHFGVKMSVKSLNYGSSTINKSARIQSKIWNTKNQM